MRFDVRAGWRDNCREFEMNILIIQGHPDNSVSHLCHALAAAYAEGAEEGGHLVRRITVADEPVTLLRSAAEWQSDNVPDYARAAQDAVMWADHMVIIFPLWMGGMPAMLRAWFEQCFREGFAMETGEKGFKRHLSGKSSRLVVTMGMPAMFYRWYFGQPGTKLLRRSILGFSGIRPIGQTLIGMVDKIDQSRAERIFASLRELGRTGK